MKITRIRVYRKDLPYIGGRYVWGDGNVFETGKATVVTVDTDAGISGCGEIVPGGNNYIDVNDEGTESVMRMLAPALIGANPLELHAMERLMDKTLRGHGYAKMPLDTAFWDILGKATGQSLTTLLGGKLTDGAPMYRVCPQKPFEETRAEIEQYRADGYRHFQIKVGNDAKTDIERIRQAMALMKPGENAYADANRGWTVGEAIRVVRAVRDLDLMIEMPCETYEECLQVRAKCELPMKLDECVTGMHMAQRIASDRSAEVVCLKLSNLGGLTKGRRVRDFLVDNGFSVTPEDTWGGDITSALISHFAASTPAKFLYNTTDIHNYNTERTGHPLPEVRDGKLYASDAPGLGIEPDLDSLGEPVAVYG